MLGDSISPSQEQQGGIHLHKLLPKSDSDPLSTSDTPDLNFIDIENLKSED